MVLLLCVQGTAYEKAWRYDRECQNNVPCVHGSLGKPPWGRDISAGVQG